MRGEPINSPSENREIYTLGVSILFWSGLFFAFDATLEVSSGVESKVEKFVANFFRSLTISLETLYSRYDCNRILKKETWNDGSNGEHLAQTVSSCL